MGHDAQILAAQIIPDRLYDYTPCFEYVAPILQSADLAIANLEVTLPGTPPYQGYPQFRSPDDLALALRSAGFDMLFTANNHSNDAGPNGLVQTLNTLDDYGFYHSGTFRSPEERRMYYPLIVYKNNFKLAFLNYTYGTNGIPTKPPAVVNLIDEEQIEADIGSARALQPDMIIAIMHWGEEYQRTESRKQRALAGKMFSWGVDLIVGAHPHVVQPIRSFEYEEPNGETRKKLVAYSLGNFISNQRRKNTDGGIMLKVDLKKSEDAFRAEIEDFHYIPVWRHIEKPAGRNRVFRVLPIAVFEQTDSATAMLNRGDLSSMKQYGTDLRSHLSGSGAYEYTLDALESGWDALELFFETEKK